MNRSRRDLGCPGRTAHVTDRDTTSRTVRWEHVLFRARAVVMAPCHYLGTIKTPTHRTDTAPMDFSAATDVPTPPRTRAPHQGRARRLVDWVVASRSHRLICLLSGVWLISAFDVVLTVFAHHQGLLHESNPIAARVLPHGPLAVLLYKLALLAFASTVLMIHRKRLLSEIAATLMLLVSAAVAVQWRLCYELYALTNSNNMSVKEIDAVDLNHIISQLRLF